MRLGTQGAALSVLVLLMATMTIAADVLPNLPKYPTDVDSAMAMGGANTAEDLAKMDPADPRRIATYIAMLLWETDDFESPPPRYVPEALKDWKAHGDEMAPVLIAIMEQHPDTLGFNIANHLRDRGKVGIDTAPFLRYARNRYEGLDFSTRDERGEIVAGLIFGVLGDKSDIPRVKRIQVIWKDGNPYTQMLLETAFAGLTAKYRNPALSATPSEEAKGEVLSSLQNSSKEGSLPDSGSGQKAEEQERVNTPQRRSVGLLGAGIVLLLAVGIWILMRKKKSR